MRGPGVVKVRPFECYIGMDTDLIERSLFKRVVCWNLLHSLRIDRNPFVGQSRHVEGDGTVPRFHVRFGEGETTNN